MRIKGADRETIRERLKTRYEKLNNQATEIQRILQIHGESADWDVVGMLNEAAYLAKEMEQPGPVPDPPMGLLDRDSMDDLPDSRATQTAEYKVTLGKVIESQDHLLGSKDFQCRMEFCLVLQKLCDIPLKEAVRIWEWARFGMGIKS